ncbi:MAG: hypothetical protein VW915_03465 [Gammaproteobacteria bacterium]
MLLKFKRAFNSLNLAFTLISSGGLSAFQADGPSSNLGCRTNVPTVN